MKRIAIIASALWISASSVALADTASLDSCMNEQDLPRVARVLDPRGQIVYARVTEQQDGHIQRAATLAPDGTPLAEVFAKAAQPQAGNDFAVSDDRVCAVVDLPESAIDSETQVIVGTGLNFAAHAIEAGGRKIFFFPKPAAPTRPYAPVYPPTGVTLLDYEVELAFVMLEAIDPSNPPTQSVLLAKSAFFLSNDVTDREPIVRHNSFRGPGTGYPEAKGQPGFLPTGPWMLRGTDVSRALAQCGSTGLGLKLWVDDETEPRQDANTDQMSLPPPRLVARLGEWIAEYGRRSEMPFLRPGDEEPRFYPLAVPEESPRLSAGSIVQTGTPEGVAMHAPRPLGITWRGALKLRSPFEQFLIEETERVAAGGTNYLAPGSVVRARIDGLGAQRFEIGEVGGAAAPHPCDGARK